MLVNLVNVSLEPRELLVYPATECGLQLVKVVEYVLLHDLIRLDPPLGLSLEYALEGFQLLLHLHERWISSSIHYIIEIAE